MSGGVDSSVAAALFLEQGYEVIGVGMRLPEAVGAGSGEESTCCGMAGMADARTVAERLRIPFYVLDYREAFSTAVIDPFCAAYARGKTPNPCVLCNSRLKFGSLLERAVVMGAESIATGHYARIDAAGPNGRLRLLKGTSQRHDQSYFLYSLTPALLARVRFPVGEMTKEEVRATAARLELPVADKPGSVDICWVGQSSYREVVARFYPEATRPGPIVDTAGRVLGQHRGIAGYTLGQRQGLGVAARERLFVVDIDVAANRITVAPASEALVDHILVGDVNWVSIAPPPEPLRVEARVRYRGALVPALVEPSDATTTRVLVQFDRPQPPIAPGQAAVFYDGDVVLGGGTITRSGRYQGAQ